MYGCQTKLVLHPTSFGQCGSLWLFGHLEGTNYLVESQANDLLQTSDPLDTYTWKISPHAYVEHTNQKATVGERCSILQPDKWLFGVGVMQYLRFALCCAVIS